MADTNFVPNLQFTNFECWEYYHTPGLGINFFSAVNLHVRHGVFHFVLQLQLCVTIFGEVLQNLSPCSRHLIPVCEQGEIFIVPHLLSHGTSVFAVSSEGPPNLVTSYDKQGVLGTSTYPDLHDSNLSVSSTSVTSSETLMLIVASSNSPLTSSIIYVALVSTII